MMDPWTPFESEDGAGVCLAFSFFGDGDLELCLALSLLFFELCVAAPDGRGPPQ